jgi:2-amino-4-hydroxy-6-hydroxymethyldihydropteridine diphosphokinase
MQTILSLGSNLGNRAENLSRATQLLTERVGTLVACSAVYESESWGFCSENAFVNCVLVIETDLTPQALLAETQAIERLMGRTEKSHAGQYHDRIIDIDLIDCDGQTLQSPDLTLPHLLMHLRPFVLQPLAEILPNWRHPIFRKTAKELLAEIHQ